MELIVLNNGKMGNYEHRSERNEKGRDILRDGTVFSGACCRPRDDEDGREGSARISRRGTNRDV